jgi:phage-related protein
MVAPTLNDYEFQFKDAGVGVLLNGTSSVPFWDVNKVSGLTDYPDLAVKLLDRDGRHGSSVYAKFFQHRNIVLDGNLVASVTDFDTPLEALRTSMIPDGNDYPFYFKLPNKTQRYIQAKPTAFKCDVDSGRRIGSCAFQLQLVAADPRHYIDGTVANWTTAVNFNLNNTGNVATSPIISITATSTTTANITVLNNATSRSIQFTTAVTSGQVVTIDLENMAVKVNGAYRPVVITLTGSAWPASAPGVTESWRVTSNIGNGSATNRSAWL